MLHENEPLFGSWYIEGKVAMGRSSELFRVTRQADGITERYGLKVVRIPASEQDFANAMLTGKYQSAEEYLNILEDEVREKMQQMLMLGSNRNVVHFENYKIVRSSNCLNLIILTELLTPLADYISNDKVNAEEIAKMGFDICHALEGFRSLGIMHREIKPENIFADSYGTYKLGDSRIAETGSENPLSDDVSTYLAPEVLNGTGADYCSDIYSLGLMMYKFLNHNRMPFLPQFPAAISVADRTDAFEKRMSGEVFPAPSMADIDLADIIYKATAFKAEERFASPFQMQGELGRYLSSLSSVRPEMTADINSFSKDALMDTAVIFEQTDIEQQEEEDIDKPVDKKMYVLLVFLLVIFAVAAVFVFKTLNPKDEETTVSQSETVTQTEESTEPATEESTTEETTTEETTTQETTTETTTEITTETTTQVTTTGQTTTAPTTTKPTTTEPTTTKPTTEKQTTTAPTTTKPNTTETTTLPETVAEEPAGLQE